MHYIITNRKVEGNPEHINWSNKEEARKEIRFATYKDGAITFLPDIAEDDKSFVSYLEPSPKDQQKGSIAFFNGLYEEIKSASAKKKDTLIFVHGYKNNEKKLHDSIATMNQLFVKNPGCSIGRIVYLAWPSNGRLLEYRDDAEDAERSGVTFGAAYLKLLKFFRENIYSHLRSDHTCTVEDVLCGGNLHLMCHSMGNRVLEKMIETINIKYPNDISPVFKEIILTGADIDYTTLEFPNPLHKLIDYCERVTVLFHRNDNALKISSTTKNPFKRLGNFGPRDVKNIGQTVACIDVTKYKTKGFDDNLINHWYHFNSPQVVDLLRDIFNGESRSKSDKVEVDRNNIYHLK